MENRKETELPCDEAIENVCSHYKELCTEDLWNEFVAADQEFMKYIYGSKYTGKTELEFPKGGFEREKVFHEAALDSSGLLKVFKDRDPREIAGVCKKLKASLKELASIKDLKHDEARGKEEINSYLGLIKYETGIEVED